MIKVKNYSQNERFVGVVPKTRNECGKKYAGWICTLVKGHVGRHEAHGTICCDPKPYATWETYDDNEVDETRKEEKKQMGKFYAVTKKDGETKMGSSIKSNDRAVHFSNISRIEELPDATLLYGLDGLIVGHVYKPRRVKEF